MQLIEFRTLILHSPRVFKRLRRKHMNYVIQLSQDLEMDPQSVMTQEEDTFVLPIGSSLKVKIKNLNPGIYLYSRICPCPTEKLEELFIYLMKANLFGQGTFGSVIGLEEEYLTLSSALPYDMNYRDFKETVEDFVNTIDFWKDEVVRIKKLTEDRIL